MNQEIARKAQPSEGRRPVPIADCLDALHYDAAYHRDRGLPPAVPLPPRIVPKDRFVRALWQRTRANVWGFLLLSAALFCVGALLIFAVQDTRDYIAGQPSIQTQELHRLDGTLFTETYETPSRQPLPERWEEKTLLKFVGLVALMCGCGSLGLACFRRAQNIEVGVPLTRANTGHLSAVETLVRASEEPVTQHQAALLRAVVETPGTPPEQLVRPVL